MRQDFLNPYVYAKQKSNLTWPYCFQRKNIQHLTFISEQKLKYHTTVYIKSTCFEQNMYIINLKITEQTTKVKTQKDTVGNLIWGFYSTFYSFSSFTTCYFFTLFLFVTQVIKSFSYFSSIKCNFLSIKDHYSTQNFTVSKIVINSPY